MLFLIFNIGDWSYKFLFLELLLTYFRGIVALCFYFHLVLGTFSLGVFLLTHSSFSNALFNFREFLCLLDICFLSILNLRSTSIDVLKSAMKKPLSPECYTNDCSQLRNALLSREEHIN